MKQETGVKNIKVNKLDKSRVEIVGSLDSVYFESFRTRALQNINDEVNIDGFRKGKVPNNILISKVGEMSILEEMAQLALSEVYPRIVVDEKIDAIGHPNIQITKIASNNPLEFKIITAVIPHIKLPDYKKISKEEKKEIKQGTEEEKIKEKEKRRIVISEKLIDQSIIDIPEILVESEIKRIEGQFGEDIKRMGVKIEDYMKHANKTIEDLRKEWKPHADKKVRLQLVLNKIAEEEKIVIEPKEIEKEVEHILEHYKDADRNKAYIYVESILMNEKVFGFLEN